MANEIRTQSGERVDPPSKPPLFGVEVIEGRLIGVFDNDRKSHIEYKINRDGAIEFEFDNYQLSKLVFAKLQDGSMPRLKITLEE